MTFRDSNGRSTNNPYSFLQANNYYGKQVKKVTTLSKEDREDFEFNLSYAESEYKSHSLFTKTLREYFDYYCQLELNQKFTYDYLIDTQVKSMFYNTEITLVFKEIPKNVRSLLTCFLNNYIKIHPHNIQIKSNKQVTFGYTPDYNRRVLTGLFNSWYLDDV